MIVRLTTIIGALALLAVPGVAHASTHRHCGSIGFSGVPFQVFVDKGSASCAQARAVINSLYHGHHRARCYRVDRVDCKNGRPTDNANTVYDVAGWQCGTGAGGGGCRRGHEQISAAYIESSAEKTARAKREDEENKQTVIKCENNPGLVLMQEGALPRYIYECISERRIEEECNQGVCREPMYGESQAVSKWEGRLREACHAVGDVPTQHVREQSGVSEYECVAQEDPASVTWVSLPYMPPEEYAELFGR
jgi:hypothetical protein